MHNNRAKTYIATVNDDIFGFCSLLPQPVRGTKKIKRIHRLVVLPDYQGLGLGIRLLNEVARLQKRYIVQIKTNSPAIVNSLKKDRNWRCIFFGRSKGRHQIPGMRKKNSSKRLTTSWEFINQEVKENDTTN
jgi:GNAT superfamily N-acetyltransferase